MKEHISSTRVSMEWISGVEPWAFLLGARACKKSPIPSSLSPAYGQEGCSQPVGNRVSRASPRTRSWEPGHCTVSGESLILCCMWPATGCCHRQQPAFIEARASGVQDTCHCGEKSYPLLLRPGQHSCFTEGANCWQQSQQVMC